MSHTLCSQHQTGPVPRPHHQRHAVTHARCTLPMSQERQRLAAGPDNWRQDFYMPGTSDTGVTTWFTWLKRFGRELPVMARSVTDLPPLMSREQVLDRYEQHTKHCTKCQQVRCGLLGCLSRGHLLCVPVHDVLVPSLASVLLCTPCCQAAVNLRWTDVWVCALPVG